LRAILVAPFSRELKKKTYWVVAVDPASTTQLAYAPEPYASYHWVVLNPDLDFAGHGDCWFASLDDAFVNSGLWRGPLPPDYEVA
jgi:hypothetical protein